LVVLWFGGVVVWWCCCLVVLWFCWVVVWWCCGLVVLWFGGLVVWSCFGVVLVVVVWWWWLVSLLDGSCMGERSQADEFFPLLVYIILSAKPPNFFSNLQFVRRFRNPEKLTGEAGYYFTTLNGAVEFIQTMGW
jgi:hypothetical protein